MTAVKAGDKYIISIILWQGIDFYREGERQPSFMLDGVAWERKSIAWTPLEGGWGWERTFKGVCKFANLQTANTIPLARILTRGKKNTVMAAASNRTPTNLQAGSDLSLASYRWGDLPQTPAQGSALRTRHATFHVAPDGVKAKPLPQMHECKDIDNLWHDQQKGRKSEFFFSLLSLYFN